MSDKENPNFVERFTIRMPDGMRDAVAKRAKANGRSMNSEIIQILQDAVSSGGLLSRTAIPDKAIRHVDDNREALKKIIRELQIIAGDKP